MKNYIQEGDTLEVTAPADTKSGDGVMVGKLFGVAAHSAKAGERVNIDREGVYVLPKVAAQAWATEGIPLYWDAGAVTSDATGGKTTLGSVLLTPAVIKTGTLKVDINDRTKYSKVVSYYQDADKAQRVEIEADADADGDSVYRIPDAFSSPAEADKAARAKAKELARGEGSVSVTVLGDAAIEAGLPLLFADVRPGLDGVPYIIKTARSKYTKTTGFEVDVSGRLYDGKSATEADSGKRRGGAELPEATDAAGKVAPSSAPGTPATPSVFLTPRFGRIDEN